MCPNYVSVSVTNTLTKKKHMEGKLYLVYNCRLCSIISIFGCMSMCMYVM